MAGVLISPGDTDYRVDDSNHHLGDDQHLRGEIGLSFGASPGSTHVGTSSSDQRFLLIFILSNFFGPDLRSEGPKLSAAQRLALGLPHYSEADIHKSILKLSEIEAVYYYVVRRSQPAVRVKLQSLYKFLQGHLASPVKDILEDERQFVHFFPPFCHKQMRYKGTYKVIEGIVFIHDPDISHIRSEDLQRFVCLTELESVTLDRLEAKLYQHGMRTDRDDERQARFDAVTAQRNDKEHGVEGVYVGGLGGARGLRGEGIVQRRKKSRKQSDMELPESSEPLKMHSSMGGSSVGPGPGAYLLLMPGMPSAEQWQDIICAARPAIAFSGTAALRQGGPSLGGVDIGECEDAYLFRISLPGVKKDEGMNYKLY